MSRRGAISYEEDHDFARFVRGLSKLTSHFSRVDYHRRLILTGDLVTYQHTIARTCSADPKLQVPLMTNDSMLFECVLQITIVMSVLFYPVVSVTDRRCRRRGSLLSTNTPTLFSDLAAAGADLELIDVNRMCTEVGKSTYYCTLEL